MLDRDQIKRDAENVLEAGSGPHVWPDTWAERCLALLTELEQAEKNLNEAADRMVDLVGECEARLAKVPPLVEALTNIAWAGGEEPVPAEQLQHIAREALAAWETE